MIEPYYVHNDAITLYQGDCLEVMPWLIDRGIKVDAVICDIPYGTTACSWDVVIPFDAMWHNIARLLKPRGACVLFGSQPFFSLLVSSNINWFRHEIVWEKTIGTNFYVLGQHPSKKHENIAIFSDGAFTYNPQMEIGIPYTDKPRARTVGVHGSTTTKAAINNNGTRYPSSVVKFSNGNNHTIHPTQKPLELMRYLIRTYTNPGDTVLDFTSGSGTTLHAALVEDRRAIGIERDLDSDGSCLGYCEYTVQRLRGEKAVTMHIDGQQVIAVQSAMQIY